MSTSRLTPFKLLLGLSAPLRDSKLYKRVGLENTRAIKSMSVMRLPTNWAKKLVAAVGSMISMPGTTNRKCWFRLLGVVGWIQVDEEMCEHGVVVWAKAYFGPCAQFAAKLSAW